MLVSKAIIQMCLMMIKLNILKSDSCTEVNMEDNQLQKYNNVQKKQLFEKINSLSSTEHDEIYRMIVEHSVNASKNKNGVFFNLSSLDDYIVEKIDKFVSYCVNNKQHLDEYDKKLNECKLNNKYAKVVNMNIKLENMVAEKEIIKDDWSKVELDSKSATKITNMIQRFNEDREKLHVKKVNSKFINAKKRFNKKPSSSDKKFDFEQVAELEMDKYIITEHTV